MDLRRLRHFMALAEALNYRVAASRLYLTQPALTRSIAALEREFGVQLFERDTRHVTLTREGEALLDRVRALLSDADALAHAASALQPGGRPELRIGFYGTALAELTHPVLRAFEDRHPDVLISVTDVTFDRAVDPLLDGELDIGLLRVPSEVRSLTAVPLFTEPASVQVRESHPAARARSIEVSDLFDEQWNALPMSTPAAWNRYWVCADQRGQGLPKIAGYGRTMTEVASLVAFRRLVSLVPSSATRQSHPGVRNVPARGVEPFRVAVLHPESKPTPLIDSFVETAINVTRRNLALVPWAESLVSP